MLRNALRFAAGAVAGALLWWYAAPAYDAFVGDVAARVLHVDRRLFDLDAVGRGRWVLLRSVSGAFSIATIPADQLTYNVILFAALLATVRKPRWKRVLIAIVILFGSHVITFAVATESLYASGRGPSDEGNVWLMAALLLRVVGMLAVAFGCWWWVAISARGYKG